MESIYPSSTSNVNIVLKETLNQTLKLISELSIKHGVCWARNEWLARKLGVTVRTIQRYIKTLIQEGYLIAKRVRNQRHLSLLRSRSVKAYKASPVVELSPQPVTPTCHPASFIEEHTEKNKTEQLPVVVSSLAQKDSDASIIIVGELISRGVAAHAATKLATKYPQECKRQLSYLETGLKVGMAAVTKITNIGAWLNSAISGAWEHPDIPKPRTAVILSMKEHDCSLPPRPQSDIDAQAKWDALPAEERYRIETVVKSELSGFMRNSKTIVNAHCLLHITKTEVSQ